MSSLGWTHLVFALIALVAGGRVVVTRKGTRWHRTVGHVYVMCMIGLNVTALFLYNLTGRANLFHAFALFSLGTIIAGMVPLLLRRPTGAWLDYHARFLSGSYVGLVAATVSEVATRVPGWNFGWAVGLATFGVSLVGTYLLQRWLPGSVARMRQ